MSNVIKFHSCHPSNYLSDKYRPRPAKSEIPEWYLEKDKHVKMPDGKYHIVFWKDQQGKSSFHRRKSWKSCPAILDSIISGYQLLTPCDIEIKLLANGYDVRVPKEYDAIDGARKFCTVRKIEEGMPTPNGYSPFQLTWRPNWYPQVPEGYTVLLTHPMYLDDLPFKTLSGFIDCANEIVGTGSIPFYVKENWEGVIPAGTPYAQIIPIKNESWYHEIVDKTPEQISDFFKMKEAEDLIGPGETKYKQHSWLRKQYE